MFQILQSIFGTGETKGGYPESLVKKAIERAIDGTDPMLRSISGYRRKLRPAVICAIDHVIELVDGLPPPVPVDLDRRCDDPLLKAFFISLEETRKVFGTDHNVAAFLRESTVVPEKVFALLAMEKSEKVFFGAELSGDIIVHDVPQVTVSFEAHRLIEPAGTEDETRRLLKRRAYDHLISIALRRITQMKVEHKDLERRLALLQSKLDILQRGGCSFDVVGSAEVPDIPGLEEKIARIESQLLDMGGGNGLLEGCLDILIDVLGQPGDHLWGKTETLILNGMGIKRTEASSNAHQLTFPELLNSEGRRLALMLVAISGEQLRRLSV